MKLFRALAASTLCASLLSVSASVALADDASGPNNPINGSSPTDYRSNQDWSQGLGLGNAGNAGDPISGRRQRGEHSDTSPAASAADATLRTAIINANDTYSAVVTTANSTFRTNTATAWKTYQDAKNSATGSATKKRIARVIARSDYDASVAVQEVMRDSAIDAAYATWANDIDTALAVYDAATTTGDVLAARTTLRNAIRSAGTDLNSALTSARNTFTNSKNQARVALLVVANNSNSTDADLVTAWDTYTNSVETAQTVAQNSRRTAFSTYKNLVTTARAAYATATGLRPSALPYTSKSLEKALKIKKR